MSSKGRISASRSTPRRPRKRISTARSSSATSQRSRRPLHSRRPQRRLQHPHRDRLGRLLRQKRRSLRKSRPRRPQRQLHLSPRSRSPAMKKPPAAQAFLVLLVTLALSMAPAVAARDRRPDGSRRLRLRGVDHPRPGRFRPASARTRRARPRRPPRVLGAGHGVVLTQGRPGLPGGAFELPPHQGQPLPGIHGARQPRRSRRRPRGRRGLLPGSPCRSIS